MKRTSKKDACKCNAGQDVIFGECQGEVNNIPAPVDPNGTGLLYWPIMEDELFTTRVLVKKSREIAFAGLKAQDEQNYKLNLVAIIDGIIRVNALLENLISQQNSTKQK